MEFPSRLGRSLRFFAVAFVPACGGLLAAPAHGALVDLISGPNGSSNATGVASGGGGLRLQTNVTVTDTLGVTINSLGFYDGPTGAGGSVGDGLSESHTVSLYNLDTNTDLADVSVPAGTGATLSGGFRYASLTTPLVVPTGTHLAVVAYTLDGAGTDAGRNPPIDPYGDFFDFNGGSSVASYALNGFNADYQFDGQTTGLPSNSGNPGTANEIFAAGSFQFTPVPEPATLSLFGLGLLALGCQRRRRA